MGRSKRSKSKTKIKKASKKELQVQYKLALDLKKKVNRKMEQRYLIGFYDSFRNGGKYNLTLDTVNAKFIGAYSTEPIYTMYDIEPDDVVIVKNGEHSIKIDVWEISKKTLTSIENNYSYYEDLTDEYNEYLKEEVMSPFGKIILFTYNSSHDTSKMIVSGDWIEHLNEVKAKGETKVSKPNINFMRQGFNNIMNNSVLTVDKEFMD